jgi:hypothetical protein
MAECLDAELPSSDEDEDDCDAENAIGTDAAPTVGVAALASLAADAFSDDAEEAVRIVALEAIGAICEGDAEEAELTEVRVSPRVLDLAWGVAIFESVRFKASIHSLDTLAFRNSRAIQLRFHVLVTP